MKKIKKMKKKNIESTKNQRGKRFRFSTLIEDQKQNKEWKLGDKKGEKGRE